MNQKILLIGTLSNDPSQPNHIRPEWAAANVEWLRSLLPNPDLQLPIFWRSPAGGTPPVSYAQWLTLSAAQREAIAPVTRDYTKAAKAAAGLYAGIAQGLTPPGDLDALGEAPDPRNPRHRTWWAESIAPWILQCGARRVCFDACPHEYYAPLLAFARGSTITPPCELWVEPVYNNTPIQLKGMCTWTWLGIHPTGKQVVAPAGGEYHCVLTPAQWQEAGIVEEVEARGFIASYRNSVPA